MPLRRRRPLLRAAATAGGAYAMGRRQATREASREPAYEAPPEAPQQPQVDVVQRLKDLGQLHDQGVLTDEEFAQQKARLLA
jgi:hypothetical protein